MGMFPGSPQPAIIPWSTISNHGYNLEMLFLSSHTGTHMDAPYHFVQDGRKIHQIPTDILSGRAALIDVEPTKPSIDVSDVRRYETAWGTIPDNTPIVFRTGWHSHISGDDYFTSNPGLSPDAARYLASKKTPLVGTDAPSIDAGGDHTFPAHHILARAGTVNVESLANLDKIDAHTLDFVILPMKIRNATGAPVRAMAIL